MAFVSFLELLEPSQGVVVKVVGILIELPRDTSVLVKFEDGLPLQGVAADTRPLAA